MRPRLRVGARRELHLLSRDAVHKHPRGRVRLPGQGVVGDLVRRQGPDLQFAGEGGVAEAECGKCNVTPVGAATTSGHPGQGTHHPSGHSEVCIGRIVFFLSPCKPAFSWE